MRFKSVKSLRDNHLGSIGHCSAECAWLSDSTREELTDGLPAACRVDEDLSWVEADALGDELLELGPDGLCHAGLVSGKHQELELECEHYLQYVDPVEGALGFDVARGFPLWEPGLLLRH